MKPLIDYWVIVDTGSTDGTQDIIREFMKDTPGELHEREWVDFAHNRTESLALAKGKADYIWWIDADEEIICEPGFEMPELTGDAYLIRTIFGNLAYYRKQIVKDGLDWRFEGVLHEYITCDKKDYTTILMQGGIHNLPRHDGARSSDPQKYKKDALVLERALMDEPDNRRYVFYLAQCYRDAHEYDNAIKYYHKRTEMGGWHEEVWSSYHNMARVMQKLDEPWEKVQRAFLNAFEFYPKRREPLYYVSFGCRQQERYQEAYTWARTGIEVPFPEKDILFVERFIYDYAMLDEFASAAFWSGHYRECFQACNRLLEEAKIPEEQVERVLKNMDKAKGNIQ
jgi:glycosyltransferase involved in cell wall biosynthesis